MKIHPIDADLHIFRLQWFLHGWNVEIISINFVKRLTIERTKYSGIMMPIEIPSTGSKNSLDTERIFSTKNSFWDFCKEWNRLHPVFVMIMEGKIVRWQEKSQRKTSEWLGKFIFESRRKCQTFSGFWCWWRHFTIQNLFYNFTQLIIIIVCSTRSNKWNENQMKNLFMFQVATFCFNIWLNQRRSELIICLLFYLLKYEVRDSFLLFGGRNQQPFDLCFYLLNITQWSSQIVVKVFNAEPLQFQPFHSLISQIFILVLVKDAYTEYLLISF